MYYFTTFSAGTPQLYAFGVPRYLQNKQSIIRLITATYTPILGRDRFAFCLELTLGNVTYFHLGNVT